MSKASSLRPGTSSSPVALVVPDSNCGWSCRKHLTSLLSTAPPHRLYLSRSPAANALSSSHRGEAVSHEMSANRAAIYGNSSLAATEEEVAASEYRRAATLNEISGDYVSAHRNQTDAQLADSKALSYRLSPGGSRYPHVPVPYSAPVILSAAPIVYPSTS